MTDDLRDLYGDDQVAALYDLFFLDYADDLLMYEQFAQRGDTPSLELATGSGRLALHLARAGMPVVALDAATAMLRRLQSSLDSATKDLVHVVEADMRDFDLGERFDLVFCAVNSFQHLLTTGDQVQCLGSVVRHLSPGGLFVMKVQTPAAVDWDATPGTMLLRDTRTDPATGEQVTRFEAADPSPGVMRRRRTYLYDRVGADGTVRRRMYTSTLKYTTPDEMLLLLDAAGLRLHQMYGDHDLSPFTEDGDTMIVVAGRADA